MEKTLKLYTLVDGGTDTPFPSSESPIEIFDFRYDATRMGGSPIISASVMYPTCLDKVWTYSVYATFNGEKYFLKQIPTSSKTNEDARYKHDIELVSERQILENVFFFDVVNSEAGGDNPKANSTHVSFFGDINEFAKRLNESLKYSKVGYNVVVDEGVKSTEELVDIENAVFMNAIQEIYNIFEVPYYFEGKTIHIGYSSNAINKVFKYGADESLLSITKQNDNAKIINRCTAVGSAENIPYYYPNNSPKGVISADLTTSSKDFVIEMENYEKFSNSVPLNGVLKNVSVEHIVRYFEISKGVTAEDDRVFSKVSASGVGSVFKLGLTTYGGGVLPIKASCRFWNFEDDDHKGVMLEDLEHESYLKAYLYEEHGRDFKRIQDLMPDENNTFYCNIPKAGNYFFDIVAVVVFKGKYSTWTRVRYNYSANYTIFNHSGWDLNGKEVYLKDVGIKCNGTPSLGDTITQKLVKYINPMDNLMPPIYRETDGAERFYNALNVIRDEKGDVVVDKDGNPVQGYKNPDKEGAYYEFNHPYVKGLPKEHIVEFNDIKPTIEGVKNGNQLPIDIFSEFMYDDDDSDETEEINGQIVYKHPYFFGKLRKLDGENGFNLFDSASEQGEMKVSMTSGHCGACQFIIGVDNENPKQHNTVQVDKDTNIPLKDGNGNVICGREYYQNEVTIQEWQQDTREREVWVALRKDIDTYGELFPNKKRNLYPLSQKDADERNAKEGTDKYKADTFVLLNINLPKGYILTAEQKLKEEIIRYMSENNDDKFSFAITFSRIFFEENPEVLSSLNENARLFVEYDNKQYKLYVNSFSYNMAKDNPLPEIVVNLSETIEVSQNAIQEAITSVEGKVGRMLGNIDVVGSAAPYFLRRDVKDSAKETINFEKGVTFGERGGVSVDEKAGTKATFDYLEIKKKATFTSLEIQHRTHVGGQVIITPASMTCSYIEELQDAWRCYFENEGDGKEKIFNTFAVGDQAICQTFNQNFNKYYWRLVVGVGDDYIDLSKTDCDLESDIPEVGDNIIQLGNRSIEERQNAIIESAFGEKTPSFTQYKGINSYSLIGKEVTKLSPYGNLLQGKVKIEEGSVGSANLTDLETGGSNLLRNSGFTGDYLSAQLNAESGLDGNSPMFSPNFDHWTEMNAVVRDSVDSLSKKEVVMDNGSLTQEMPQQMILGESYVLSFRAKGTSFTYSVGGVTKTIALTQEYKKYVEKFIAQDNGSVFAIRDANAVVCDLQLERGTVVSGWSHNYMDNTSELAYYERLKYVSDAIKQGDTTILGGLILSNMLMLGKKDAEGNFENASGMSGIYNDKNDVAFYGGGSYDKAIATVMKYANNPQYKPTDAELANMVNFVVTHGGRAILNDAIVRGTIYAKDGEFTGTIHATSGDFKGRINAIDGSIGVFDIRGNDLMSYYSPEGTLDPAVYTRMQAGRLNVTYSKGYDFLQRVTMSCGLDLDRNPDDPYNAPNITDMLEVYAIHQGSEEADRKVGIVSNIKGYKENYAFYSPNGQFAGFRPAIKKVTNTTITLDKAKDHTIIVNGTIGVYLPIDPELGQEYEFFITSGSNLTLYSQNSSIDILNCSNWASQQYFTWNGTLYVKVIYGNNEGTYWWAMPR